MELSSGCIQNLTISIISHTFTLKYVEYEAEIDFDGNIISGDFPANKLKLVRAWAEIHREELEADWILAFRGEHTFKIDPLR